MVHILKMMPSLEQSSNLRLWGSFAAEWKASSENQKVVIVETEAFLQEARLACT